jgi:hypothetical protein
VGLGSFRSARQGARLSRLSSFARLCEHDTYQINDAFSYVTDSHSMKFGVELRRRMPKLWDWVKEI